MGVELRDVQESDLPTFFEQQLDPAASEMAAFPPRESDAFTEHWMTNILGDDAVVAKTVLFDGDVAGNMVSFVRDGEREVGYWIGREFWGKGIATEALGQFLGFVDDRPLFAHVASDNVASFRVLEKCGFAISSQAKGTDEIQELILRLT